MMKFRKAIQTDIHQLEKLFLVTRQQTFYWERPDKFKLKDYDNATLGETVFVAEEDGGKIIGFISVWEKDIPPFIHHLFVGLEHQKKGVGSFLIRNLFDRLPLPYRLKCVLRNQNALSFYLKNNWIEIDRGDGGDGEYVLLELPARQQLSNN